MNSCYNYKLVEYVNGICSPEGQHFIDERFPVLAAWLQTNRDFKIGSARLASYSEPAPPTNLAGSTFLKSLANGEKFYATPVWAVKMPVGSEGGL
jgi:hypothetical protein